MSMSLLQQLVRATLDLACGSRCPGCGAAGTAVVPCPACRDQLARTPHAPGGAFVDEGVAARLVRAGKHGHWRGAGRALARLVVARVELPPVDVVTWVPADRARRARRGGCLPQSLAQGVATQLHVPARQLLVRSATSSSQRGRGRQGRIANVVGAYRLAPGVQVAGQRVLLVDDVRTTGATLAATGRVLQQAGAHVHVVAAVAVDRSRHPGGCDDDRRGISAPCAEFPLTSEAHRADTVGHVQGKASST
jgi:predicted amidophosphoribosyltransferase